MRKHTNKVCFATESKAKRTTTDVTYNYLHEGWVQKFVRVKNKHTQNQTQLGKEPTIITEKIHQEQKKIFQIRST